MSISLLPRCIAREVPDITPELLHARKIKLLMLDFDNTIVPYTTSVPTDKMKQWILSMQQSDILLCIVSNSKKERVKVFCAAYGLDCITHAHKPFARGIRQCLAKYGVPAGQAALVGDQIFTDTLGANCQGVYSILVSAINNHNFWLKARHVLELPFIAMAKNRRLST